MTPPLLFIASRRESVADSLEQVLRLLLIERSLPPYRIVKHVYREAKGLFEAIEAAGSRALRDSIVLLDLGAEPDLTWNLGQSGDAIGVAPHLALAFPEVYPIFFNGFEYQFHGLSANPTIDALIGPQLRADARVRGLDAAAPEINKQIRARAEEVDAIIRDHHLVSAADLPHLMRLIGRHAKGFRTLFDATGLRSLLKLRLIHENTADRDARPGVGTPQPLYREFSESRLARHAVIADEESPFVYLNGLSAYKAGFRGWLASTMAEFHHLLRADGLARDDVRRTALDPSVRPARFDVSLLDYDLRFPDHWGESPSPRPVAPPADLLDDHLVYKRLGAGARERMGCRYLITSEDAKGLRRNDVARNICVVAKPCNGIHGLLDEPGPDAWRADRAVTLRTQYRGLRKSVVRIGASGHGTAGRVGAQGRGHHSAPFAHAKIARDLIDRVDKVLGETPANIEDYAQAALLANEAKEILGGSSLTLSFECLARAEEAEALAEVSFFGASTDLRTRRRLELLQKEAYALARGRGGALQFLIQAITRLRTHYQDSGYFAAAEECHRWKFWYEGSEASRSAWLRARESLAKAWSSSGFRAKWSRGWQAVVDLSGLLRASLSYIAYRYIALSTGAGTRVLPLLAACVGWIVIFACIYGLLLSNPSAATPWSLFISSSLTFLEVQAAPQVFAEAFSCPRGPLNVVLLVELVFAYIHLGLFISVIYRKITRSA